ncbi:hypothetical protein CSUI_005383, partial [Cystoisospora suis]
MFSRDSMRSSSGAFCRGDQNAGGSPTRLVPSGSVRSTPPNGSSYNSALPGPWRSPIPVDDCGSSLLSRRALRHSLSSLANNAVGSSARVNKTSKQSSCPTVSSQSSGNMTSGDRGHPDKTETPHETALSPSTLRETVQSHKTTGGFPADHRGDKGSELRRVSARAGDGAPAASAQGLRHNSVQSGVAETGGLPRCSRAEGNDVGQRMTADVGDCQEADCLFKRVGGQGGAAVQENVFPRDSFTLDLAAQFFGRNADANAESGCGRAVAKSSPAASSHQKAVLSTQGCTNQRLWKRQSTKGDAETRLEDCPAETVNPRHQPDKTTLCVSGGVGSHACGTGLSGQTTSAHPERPRELGKATRHQPVNLTAELEFMSLPQRTGLRRNILFKKPVDSKMRIYLQSTFTIKRSENQAAQANAGETSGGPRTDLTVCHPVRLEKEVVCGSSSSSTAGERPRKTSATRRPTLVLRDPSEQPDRVLRTQYIDRKREERSESARQALDADVSGRGIPSGFPENPREQTQAQPSVQVQSSSREEPDDIQPMTVRPLEDGDTSVDTHESLDSGGSE